MSEFEYTHNPYTKSSSAVDEVWYNENTKQLAVDLHDDVYVYSGVPKSRYEALVHADSLGRAFREIKRDYGPSEYLGDVDYIEFDEVSYEAPDMGNFASVTDVRRSKGLTYAADATLNGEPLATSTGPHLSLTPATAKADVRRHTVVFETAVGVKSHDVQVSSVDEAAATVREMGNAFGVSVNVKEVTVHFE